MKSFCIVGALLLLTGAAAMAEETTSVQNGSNSATVTQSGPQGDTQKSVERTPGHTRIEQHDGSNSAVITQDSGSAVVGSVPDDLDDAMPVPPPRADVASRTDADVYGAVRERASSQGQANLDRLMGLLGPGAAPK